MTFYGLFLPLLRLQGLWPFCCIIFPHLSIFCPFLSVLPCWRCSAWPIAGARYPRPRTNKNPTKDTARRFYGQDEGRRKRLEHVSYWFARRHRRSVSCPLFFPLLLHDTKKRDREVGSRAHPRARLLATTQENCRKDRKEEKKCLKKRAQQRGASDTVRSPPPRSRNLPAGQCIFGAALPSFLLRVLVIHCLGSRHAMAVPRLIGEKKGNPRRGPRGGGGRETPSAPVPQGKEKESVKKERPNV